MIFPSCNGLQSHNWFIQNVNVLHMKYNGVMRNAFIICKKILNQWLVFLSQISVKKRTHIGQTFFISVINVSMNLSKKLVVVMNIKWKRCLNKHQITLFSEKGFSFLFATFKNSPPLTHWFTFGVPKVLNISTRFPATSLCVLVLNGFSIANLEKWSLTLNIYFHSLSGDFE